MKNDLWCVLFLSTSKRDLTVEGVEQLLHSVRQERQSNDLTGLVIYARGNNLMGLIEGHKSNVISYYTLKLFHPIHHNVSKLYNGPIPYRFFENLPLAIKVIGNKQLMKFDDFKTINDKKKLKKFLEIEHPVPSAVNQFIKKSQTSRSLI